MWKDNNDKIEKLYLNLKNIEKFPSMCPVCRENAAHIYMHIYDDETRRGGLWIWCSECYTFSHSSIYVPQYWKNCPLVKNEKLYAIPTYLDEIKETIDKHANVMKSKYMREEV